jgi:cyclopropane fatty-acyl-phospholipid synthase-like methyltransferase
MASFSKWTYEAMYRFSKPRWDGDVTPPKVKAFVEQHEQPGHALDLGCGTGTHAIYLAQHGWQVVGVDFSGKAIELAQAKARGAKVSVDFRAGDVTRLDFLTEPFDFMLDIGCFHGLGEGGRKAYAEHMARLGQAGSTLLLWAFTGGTFGIGILPERMPNYFSPAFAVARVDHGDFHGRPSAWYWLTRQ